jgi:hypothetical protein
MTAEPHENSNTLDPKDSSNPKFNGGSKSMWEFFFVMQIVIPIYYVLHS